MSTTAVLRRSITAGLRASRQRTNATVGTNIGRWGGGAVLLVLFISTLTTSSPTWVSLVQQMAVDGCLGLSVVVLLGYAGELSFAYGLIFGVSGYVSWALMDHGVPMLIAFVGGLVASTIVCALIAVPALRIRQLQLAMVTVAAGLAGAEIFSHISGYSGIVGLPVLSLGSRSVGIADPGATAQFLLVILLVTLLLCELVLGGRTGRRWLLVQADEGTARGFGISVPRERLRAFAASGAVLGGIGAVFPISLGLLSPSAYGFQSSVAALIVALLGGLLFPGGCIPAAVLFVILQNEMSGIAVGLSQIVYGGLLLLLLMFLPRGLIGLIETGVIRLLRLIRERGGSLANRETSELPDNLAADTQMLPGPAGAADEVVLLRRGRRANVAEAEAVIRGTGLQKTFGSFVAVSDVQFEARAGCVTGIIGANGAGKSTLVNLLTGFASESGQGTVELRTADGMLDVSAYASTRRARLGVRRTFQHPHVVPELSVKDNLLVGLECADWQRTFATGGRTERIEELLELCGLTRYRDRYPADLPYGVVKLVDVARCVAVVPQVVFLDEPAAGLGAAELPYLNRCIADLATRGVAIVVIEHNLDFIANITDYMYAMDFGRVIEQGEPDSVLASEAVLASYSAQVGLQS